MTSIWAHRGASAKAPENTLAAFAEAIRDGANGIELDVQLSSDGALVVIHDETIDRTSNGRGKVGSMPLSELKKYDYSCGNEAFKGSTIPTLHEVYELVRPTSLIVNVELKTTRNTYPGIEKAALEAEKQMGMQGRVIYSSFNHFSLKKLHSLSPDAKLGMLYSYELINPWSYARYLNAGAIHCPYQQLLDYPKIIHHAHSTGISVHTWVVDHPATMRDLMRMDVDVIITNCPDLGVAVFYS